MHFVRSSCSNAGSLDRAYFLPRSTQMQRNCNHVLLARLAWRLRLHSCAGLSELRGSSCILSARPLSRPWCARLGPTETSATLGSTSITDQPSAQSAATAASVGNSSLTMLPSSMVPKREAVFSTKRKREKCCLEDGMETVLVCTFVRRLAIAFMEVD
jgi:hypothetical protein